jgi:hypothetical protein
LSSIQRISRAQQDFACAALGGIAVHFREQGFQFGDFHAVIFGHVRQRVNAVPFLFDLPQLTVPHDHGIDHRELLETKLVLVQATDPLIGRDRHVAGAGREAAVEDFHKGGFTAAVGADQAVAVAVTEFDGDIFEQWLGTKLHGDIGGRDHGSIPGIDCGALAGDATRIRRRRILGKMRRDVEAKTVRREYVG